MGEPEIAWGLTWNTLAEVLPIAKSDRRTHADLFAELLTEKELKDDSKFYPALLDRIRDDFDFLRRLERRFFTELKEKDQRKAFSSRVVRWLLARSEFVDDPYDLLHGSATIFPFGTAEHELHQLLRALVDNFDGEQPETPQAGTPSGGMVPSDGSAELARLRALLADSDGADAETAEAVAEAARTWADAVAEWQAGEMAQIAVVREPILKALHHLNGAGSGHDMAAFKNRVHELGLAPLKELGPLAESVLECSAQYQGSAETFGTTKAHKAELDQLEDYEALSEVVGKLARLKTQQVAAQAALQHAVDAFRAALLAESGARTESAQQTAHDDDSDCRDESGPDRAAEKIGRADTVDLGSSEAEPEVEGPQQADEREADPVACDIEGDEAAEVPEEADAEPFAFLPEEEAVEIGEVTAAEPAGSVDEKPLASSIRAAFPHLLAQYLEKGEPVFAFHLADLAIERGMEPGLPKSVLLSLALSNCLSGPDDPLLLQIDAALAEAVPQAGSASQAVTGLIFAALLPPALLSPESSARNHLANLSMDGWLGAYGPLQHALGDLGYDFRLSVGELAELVGAVRERQVPATIEALRDWSDGAKASQSLHAPTAYIVHDIVGHEGEFGSVIEKVLSGDAKAEEAVRGLLEKFLDNRSALADLIDRRERAMGRPRRDKIRGIALDWACRKLSDGCAALDDWRHAKAADHGQLEGKRKAALERQINSLRKELIRLCRLDASALTLDEGLQDAAYRTVARVVEELAMLVEGRALVTAPRRAGDILRTPLLRLPGACMDDLPEDSADFAMDRKAQRDRLFEALQEPDRTIAPNERTALSARVAESAILPARQLLDILKRSKQITPREGESLAQEIAEREASTRAQMTSRVNSLRQSFVTLSNLYLGTGDELRKGREQLEEIASALKGDNELTLPATNDMRVPGVPSDFPGLAVLLDELECIRDDARTRIGDEQRVRLEKIASERSDLAPAVETILKDLHSLDPITVEDTIATLPSLGSGQILAAAHQQDEEPFETFFPAFVELVESASPNQGAVLTAARAGDVLGPLDFSTLEESGRTQAKQLMERWWQATNALRKPSGDLRGAARQVLEDLGFTEVRLSGETAIKTGAFKAMDMRAAPLEVEGWFLPPDFGSGAMGTYRLFLARPEVADDEIARELAKLGVETPCILFMFGRLSRTRRQDFARLMRRQKQRVLLVDETQILFLATLGANRLQTLFSCASPFGYVQPYTTDPGDIPREMFFGRTEEIAKIVSRSAEGCLVYGGRQLGKSALLNHVRKLQHQPTRGLLAFYRNCDQIARLGSPAHDIWRVVADALASEGVGKGDATPEAVATAVRGWLGADTGRRILMLLDETNAFMAFEAQSAFQNLVPLKDLMETTARRFKVVFAGLHNVRRAHRAPNTPLAHFGVICVGPLNATPENRSEARRLVIAPLRAAGFDYESLDLAYDILARVNHYPSLVQVFCKALLEGLYTQGHSPRQGPRWTVGRAQIFEGASYEDITQKIRERFRLTLDLDPRYDLIANVLALHRLERGNEAVLRTGLRADEIHEQVAAWWPTSLPQPRDEAFVALLEEMVELGVLGHHGPSKDRFGLRTAQVAQMLGGKRMIEDQIERIATLEAEFDYDPDQFHPRLDIENSDIRSPLSDAELQALFSRENPGPRIVIATPILEPVAEALGEMASHWGKGFEVVRVSHSVEELRKALTGRVSRARLVLISPGWSDEWIDWAAKQESVQKGTVIPVFVAKADWLEGNRRGGRNLPAREFMARPWSELMLRAYLRESDANAIDRSMVREALLEGSGGIPTRLTGAVATLRKQIASSSGDPEALARAWAKEQSISPAEVGLSAAMAAPFSALDGGAAPDDVDALAELMAGEWDEAKPMPSPAVLWRLFADLGLIESGKPEHIGIRLTSLGRLVLRPEPAA